MVYVTITWYYADKRILHSTDRVKIDDIYSYRHYVNVYQNDRFDDFYLIINAYKIIKDYILNNKKHAYLFAYCKTDFFNEPIEIWPEGS